MKIGRNDPCPCGSGKKYKHCCYEKDQAAAAAAAAAVREAAAQQPADDEKEAEETHESHDPRSHRSGERQRFHGRPGGGGFRSPRSARGSQRGT